MNFDVSDLGSVRLEFLTLLEVFEYEVIEIFYDGDDFLVNISDTVFD